MFTFGSYTIVVKPAATVLAAAITIGIAAPTMVRLACLDRLPSYGYVNPDRWRVDTRDGAKATIRVIASDGELVPPQPTRGIPVFNSDTGFDVLVVKPGTGSDSIFLRNAFSRLQSDMNAQDLKLTFEARAVQKFPLLFTVRDGRPGMDSEGPLWSKEMQVAGDWQPYEVDIPVTFLKKTANLDYILAVHLGKQTGDIAFRNIHMR